MIHPLLFQWMAPGPSNTSETPLLPQGGLSIVSDLFDYLSPLRMVVNWGMVVGRRRGASSRGATRSFSDNPHDSHESSSHHSTRKTALFQRLRRSPAVMIHPLLFQWMAPGPSNTSETPLLPQGGLSIVSDLFDYLSPTLEEMRSAPPRSPLTRFLTSYGGNIEIF